MFSASKFSRLLFTAPIAALIMVLAMPTAGLRLTSAIAQPTASPATETLLESGDRLYQAGKFQEALAVYQQVLATVPPGDRSQSGEAYFNLGKTYYQLQQYTEALQAYQQALTLRSQVSEGEAQGAILNGIGRTYLRLNQYRPAMSAFQAALELRLQVSDRRGEAITRDDIGILHQLLGEYELALRSHQQALAAIQGVGKPGEAAEILNNMGLATEGLGDYRAALASYQLAFEQFKANNLTVGVGKALTNIGAVQLRLGQSQAADESLQTALKLAKAAANPIDEGTILNSIGLLNERLGRYPQALDYYQQANVIFQQGGYPRNQADALNNIGIVHEQLGDYNTALKFYQQALAIRQQVRDRVGIGTSLNNIGSLYRQLKQPNQALELYQQALKTAQETGDRAGEATALNNLGSTYSSLKRLPQAVDLYQQALAIREEIGDRNGIGNSLNNLGSVYQSLNQPTPALAAYNAALGVAKQVGSRQMERVILSNLASFYAEQKQPQMAIAFYKSAINVSELIRQDLRVLSRQQQESYTKTVADSYRALADLLLAQGSRILEAQAVLELLKVQELQDFTRTIRNAAQPSNVALSPNEAKIIQRYGSLIAFGQTVETCKKNRCPNLSQLNDQLQALTQDFNQTVQAFESEIRQRRASDDAFLDPKRLPKLKEIVEAQPKTVLIYPLVMKDKIWLVLAAPGGVLKSQQIPVSRQQLGEAVLKFRQQVQDPRVPVTTIQATGKQLYDWLILPLEPELKANQIENLVFSLDRVTRYIPIAALFDGKQYLIENYAISTVLSAELTDTRDRLPIGTKNTSILAVGADKFPDLPPLPNVALEINAIVRKQPSSTSGIYPGIEFLNQAFSFRALRDHLTGHKILHIATHGAFVPGRPESSYLVMGNGDKLTIPQIQTLQDLSDVHLVVLSACETALGGADQDGVEISGISSYFLSAGAKAVIASLWSVSDESTSLLMQQFYSALAHSTAQAAITKPQALRQAQLSLLYGGGVGSTNARGLGVIGAADGRRDATGDRPTAAPYTKPFYWAPFILIGNSL